MIAAPSLLSHQAGFRPIWVAPRPPIRWKSAFLSWLICWRRTTVNQASATSTASTRRCLGNRILPTNNVSAAKTHIDQVLARCSRLELNTIGSDLLRDNLDERFSP